MVSNPLFSAFNLFITLSLNKSILIFEFSLTIIFVSVFNDLSSFSVNVEFSKFKLPLKFSISLTSALELLNVNSAFPFTLLLNTLSPVILNSPACRSILPILFNLEPSISIFVVPTFIKSPVPVIFEVIVPSFIKFKLSFVLSFKSIFETPIFFLISNSPDFTSNVLKLVIFVLTPRLNLPLPSLITLLVFPSLIFLFSKFILVTSILLSDESITLVLLFVSTLAVLFIAFSSFNIISPFCATSLPVNPDKLVNVKSLFDLLVYEPTPIKLYPITLSS